MYYLYAIVVGETRSDFICEIMSVPNATDSTYNELKGKYNIMGQFGRLDYAEAWRDYWNNNIDRCELRKRLGV